MAEPSISRPEKTGEWPMSDVPPPHFVPQNADAKALQAAMVSRLSPATTESFDVDRLKSLAAQRAEQARKSVDALTLEYAVERAKLFDQARIARDQLERKLADDDNALRRRITEAMRPAQAMLDYVSKLL